MTNKTLKTFIAMLIAGVVVIVGIALLGDDEAKKQPALVQETLGNPTIEELESGDGQEVKSGDRVSVHYAGTLTDGTKFDSSLDRNLPFQFDIGKGMVIPCWDRGLVGKKVGSRIKLTCPPETAYGAVGAGSVIPPNATLIFEIEILGIENQPREDAMPQPE